MSMLMVIIGLIYSKLDACQVVVHPNHYCTGLICKVIVLKGCEVLGFFVFWVFLRDSYCILNTGGNRYGKNPK